VGCSQNVEPQLTNSQFSHYALKFGRRRRLKGRAGRRKRKEGRKEGRSRKERKAGKG
jgi:hypothetical protein